MRLFQASVIWFAVTFSTHAVLAQTALESEPRPVPSTDVLTVEQWKHVDQSIERALGWLATQQKEDGSFDSIDIGQPAVTAFCLMAFLAQGESPASGQYKKQLMKAIDYIASQQKPNGLIAVNAPHVAPIPRRVDHKIVGKTTVYNHPISALALTEAYGQCNQEQAERLAPVIERAIAASLEMQRWGGKAKEDRGGWRYLDLFIRNHDSDLSITGWQLMFLRSARNAGFDVPDENIEAAVKYVENCYLSREDRKVHSYRVGGFTECTRAMAGAGILGLAHAGKFESEEAIASGEWLLKHDFARYNFEKPLYGGVARDRYHYGAVICAQAMYQLGGKYWHEFFPILADAMLANQNADGSWPPDKKDYRLGSCFSTSLCILSLSVPNQILPIFQR